MEILDICKNFNSSFSIKIIDRNYNLLKNYFENKINNDLKKSDYKQGYEHIFVYFKNCDNEDEVIYYIYIIRFFIKYLEKPDILKLLDEINKKTDKYINNKFLVSSLKSLLIYCNKYINNKNINKKIDSILDVLKITNNEKRIIFYLNKISIYLDKTAHNKINYKNIIEILNNIYKSADNYKSSELFLKLINKCKMYGKITNSEIESILLLVNKNIYSYIYFLNNKDNIYDEKDKTLKFILNFGYENKKFEEIDILNLKRGFITGLNKNNKNYLLKYQPNKSVMELIINCYLNSQNYTNFLLPNYFFINEDNSYFYIIEKYNTDLHKYFNILESNNKTLSFKNILTITKFIIDSISILHKHNIIHSDFKLENIVLNIDDEHNIKDLKIIDFDVGLFNIIPEYLNNVSEKYQKILKNKKTRGTRIYMIKDTEMSFNNDIFSMGVISLILMYKNMKLFLAYSKKLENRKIIKKLASFRNEIEEHEVKIKLLDLIETIVNKNCVKKITKRKWTNNKPENFIFFDENNNINKYKLYQQFILDCLECKYNIEELKEKYNKLF